MSPPLAASAEFSHGPQRPRRVPLLPGLNVGRSYYDYHSYGGSAKRYRSAGPDVIAISDGPDLFNQVLMGDGVWYLHAGDRPALRLAHRPYWPNSYIKPDLIPGLGVSGDLYFAALTDEGTVPLHLRARVEARFRPGEAEWRCTVPRSREPGPHAPSAATAHGTHIRTTAAVTRTARGADPATESEGAPSANAVPAVDASGAIPRSSHLRLRARPLVSTNGCVLLLEGNTALAVRLDLAAGPDAGTHRLRTPPPPRLSAGHVVLDHPEFPYTRVVAGTTAGAGAAIDVQSDTCVVLTLRPGAGLLLVWGYTDYDRDGVAAAYRRLEERPFAAPGWVAQMRGRWFEHWVGRCLHPEQRFRELMARFPETAAEAREFWHPRRRLRVETPEAELDTVVNRAAVDLRYQFEYPAFIHGILGWNKYGKINFGYYAADDAGMHREAADSLHFISGSQDAGGRQRYLSAAFHSIGWAEEVDFYFVEQVWHHYRWTADRAFLEALYPAARRSLEHALAASDPHATGIMTGYYEFWQNDAHSRGGKCVVHGALAWGALTAAAGMAQILQRDEDAARYRDYAALVQRRLERELWHEQTGAFGSAEWNGDVRPRPETQEQFLPALRGLGSARQRRRAARYLRDRFLLRPQAGVTLELINDWWPIFWSHHYVANGDALLSVLAAARNGDIDGYWPLVRSIVQGALTSSDGSLRSTQDNAGRGTGLRHTAEVQAPLLQMVVEGLFGIRPAVHENRLLVRPNFPRHWPHARLQRPGLTLRYRRQESPAPTVTIEVTCDLPRRITVELPVRGEVRSATVNGTAVAPRYTADVGAARLTLDSAAPAGGNQHVFVVTLAPEAQVAVPERVVVGNEAPCRVSGARIQGWEERSGRVAATAIQPGAATLRAEAEGPVTGFLRLSTGQAEWDEPVDLEAVPPWEVVERLAPALVNDRATVVSPRLDLPSRSLLLEVSNNTSRRLCGQARVLDRSAAVSVAPGATQPVRIDLSPVWSALSPGTLPVAVTMDGTSARRAAVTWLLADPPRRWSGGRTDRAGRPVRRLQRRRRPPLRSPLPLAAGLHRLRRRGGQAPAAARTRRARLRPASLAHGATRLGLPAGTYLWPGAGHSSRVRSAVGVAAAAAALRAAARPAVPHRRTPHAGAGGHRAVPAVAQHGADRPHLRRRCPPPGEALSADRQPDQDGQELLPGRRDRDSLRHRGSAAPVAGAAAHHQLHGAAVLPARLPRSVRTFQRRSVQLRTGRGRENPQSRGAGSDSGPDARRHRHRAALRRQRDAARPAGPQRPAGSDGHRCQVMSVSSASAAS